MCVRYGFVYSKFPAATIKNRRESQFSDAIEKERFAGFYIAATVVRRFMSRVSTIRFISVGYTRTATIRKYVVGIITRTRTFVRDISYAGL